MNPAVAPPALVLRDIHLPDAPSLWPPAPGWWLLAGGLIALLAWGIPALLRRRRIRQQRERLLAMLAALQSELAGEPSPQRLAQLGELLRRLALLRYPRSEVASLSGGAWLRFLDETGGEGGFSDGAGRVLAEGPYRRRLPPDFDPVAVATVIRGWVEKNAHHAWRQEEDDGADDDAPQLGFVR
ncbi:MAG TPA: DUF4381 domain-containing protein [Burkholderiaceae bacterium]|nr:DUF4381 domain-containing protein [Burkholderiaceae bacterium]